MGIDPFPGESPGESATQILMLAGRSLRRLARARRSLPDASGRRGRVVLDALLEVLRDLPRETRLRTLVGPDLRGFLTEAETWVEVRRLSLPARSGGRAARRRLERLFVRVSRTEHLTRLVPRGRIDAAFPARCLRFALGRLDDTLFDLAALVLGLRLIHPRAAGALDLELRFREDAEQGRPAGRIDLGTVAGPAGPLAIVVTRRRGAARRVHATLRGATLTLSSPGVRSTVIPAAGTRLTVPDLDSPAGRRRGPGRGAELRLLLRDTIPGTSIVLAPVVESSPRRLVVTREDARLGDRLARALRIVQVAWPEARREIERRTFMVVPIREAGTVSYSMAARPGVSYINVFGKSLLDLADDLLHETAHHRLHDLQETTAFLRPGPETLEIQAFDSPWRGTRRPLHGILHGVYTFLYRAALFARILRAARRRPGAPGAAMGEAERRFLHREYARERRMIAAALRDLETASRSGLLTPAGRRLLGGMRVQFGGLARGARGRGGFGRRLRARAMSLR